MNECPDGGASQVYRIFIKAPAQSIWDAIVKPEFTEQYFYGARVETTGHVGSPFRYRSSDGRSLWGDGVVLASDCPHLLRVTWRSLFSSDAAGEPPSRVTWNVDDRQDDSCLLAVTHDRLEKSPKTASEVAGAGWMRVLSGLKTLLETGRPLTALHQLS